MEKTIVGIVGAVAGLATVGGAQAATPAVQELGSVPAAQSFAELLDPIPNALAALRAADAAAVTAPASDETGVQVAQLYIGVGHHHHHHHNRYFYRHHHHHRGVVIRVPRRFYGHHHHHHHHSRYYRGY